MRERGGLASARRRREGENRGARGEEGKRKTCWRGGDGEVGDRRDRGKNRGWSAGFGGGDWEFAGEGESVGFCRGGNKGESGEPAERMKGPSEGRDSSGDRGDGEQGSAPRCREVRREDRDREWRQEEREVS